MEMQVLSTGHIEEKKCLPTWPAKLSSQLKFPGLPLGKVTINSFSQFQPTVAKNPESWVKETRNEASSQWHNFYM